jgi:hypothetical protein
MKAISKYNRYKFTYFSTVILVFNITFTGCNSSPSKPATKDTALNKSGLQPEQYEEVSIINLIATPERYNNKLVRIVGYLNMEYENDAVYMHKEDYDLKISKNCIGVEIPRATRYNQHVKDCNKKYVFVEGVFNMNRANEGSFNSSITNINRLEIN